jgi:outer membrane protein assembly factor BamA
MRSSLSVLLLTTLILLMDFHLSQGNPADGQRPDSILQDSTQVRIASITLIGNKITKDHIILRELTFRVNDSIRAGELEAVFRRSEENLMNTSLFNTARITRILNGHETDVYIIFTERWYIFPIPIFEIAERNFNVWWKTKDFSRAVYGGVLTWNNFRGRNEEVGITLRMGYTQRMSFFYKIPFIDKKQKAGLSFGIAHARNRQTSYATINDENAYYKNEEEFVRNETGISVSYSHRGGLYESHLIEGTYRYAEVLDTLIRLNPDYFSGDKNSTRYFSLRYLFRSDHRDLVVYPLKGYYLDAEFSKNGFSFLNDDVNIFSLTARLKKYWDLSSGFYASAGLTGKYSGDGKIPYYNNRALGYGTDYLRGYEYYVMDGQHYAMLKSNLKYRLLAERVVHARFLPMSKFNVIPYSFYLNLYGDMAYVWEDQFSGMNSLVNDWQYSGGLGIDFVTYYDLVFRFEFSVNKLGESGFFLHFTAPI